MDSCPKELECYDRAYANQIKAQDSLQYIWWKNYGVSAMSVAISNCFSKKSKAKFIEKPVMGEILDNAGMSEEERYERELKKALLVEEQWIQASRQKGLPETII
nr:MAG TPA: hypothetical protein [Caudoviricetes sp.]